MAAVVSFPVTSPACLPVCRLGPCKTISCSDTTIILAEWNEAPATPPGSCRRMIGWVASLGYCTQVCVCAREIIYSHFKTPDFVCRSCGRSSSTRSVATRERLLESAGTAQWTSCLTIPCGTNSGTWWVSSYSKANTLLSPPLLLLCPAPGNRTRSSLCCINLRSELISCLLVICCVYALAEPPVCMMLVWFPLSAGQLLATLGPSCSWQQVIEFMCRCMSGWMYLAGMQK